MADRDLVRLLIADTDAPNQIFTDAQLDQFLTLETYVKLAAAQALDTIASNEALVSKKIRTLDLQTDGPAVATALHAQADSLREQHYSAGLGEFEVTTDLGTGSLPRLASYEVAVTGELGL